MISFPLAPALSQRERENRIQPYENRTTGFVGCILKFQKEKIAVLSPLGEG